MASVEWRLKEWLRRHGYRSVDVAEWLGVHPNTLRNRLSGDGELKVAELMIIAQRTRMTGEQFMWILKGEHDDD